tara:strand:+ start:339 stop:1343 length:1005 start_codon:yes stop_codon:yes gene_type:complete
MNLRENKIITYWLYTGLFLIIVMVLIGGLTRLTNSGLSMVEWRLISGSVPPLNESEWNEVFIKYQQFPEYQKINKGMSLSDFKVIFFWEYIHRLFGRLIGLVFIIPFLIFWTKGWLNKRLKKQLTLLLFLGSIQGFLGWFMVKSGLVDVPAVSHFRLASHLLTAFILIAYIYWIIMELTEENKGDDNVNIGTLIKTFIILILVQIIYGAFMAGLKAGYLLQPNSNLFEKLFSYSFRDSNDFSLLNNGYDIQAFHRLLAWVIAIFAFFIYKKTKKTQLMNEGRLLLYVVFIQITLGICTLLLGVNIYFAVIHQFFAIILMISALRVLYFSSGNSQ